MSEGELRAMVRDLLRETLAGSNQGKAAGAKPHTRKVALATDRHVADFVTLLIGLIDDPATGKLVRTGGIKFTLAGDAQASVPSVSNTAAPATVPATRSAENHTGPLGGVITEARIARLAGSGTVVLSPGAVITPLARDRARSLGLKFERKR